MCEGSEVAYTLCNSWDCEERKLTFNLNLKIQVIKTDLHYMLFVGGATLCALFSRQEET